ncbi:hypothetical protein ABZP36_006760 [Zizania latifolia]
MHRLADGHAGRGLHNVTCLTNSNIPARSPPESNTYAMSPRFIAICLVALLLFVPVSHGGRIGPIEPGKGKASTKAVEMGHDGVDRVEGCEGLGEEEDCMAKRLLAAQLDYIYTQGSHN